MTVLCVTSFSKHGSKQAPCMRRRGRGNGTFDILPGTTPRHITDFAYLRTDSPSPNHHSLRTRISHVQTSESKLEEKQFHRTFPLPSSLTSTSTS